MKKLFLSSMVLLLFSFSIIIFQMSCKKSASAQSPNSAVTTVAFIKETNQVYQIWTCTSTGTNLTQVPIPSQYSVGSVENIVTNGVVLFAAQTGTNPVLINLYSCNIDGSNISQLTNEPAATNQIYF
ncbi:MAG TPA: hypothetical protein VK705_06565 [Ferruginibacter sp.]|jgi:hypothetical protein|nr:hypothetical protein [Ferruginibacter sp.]